MAKDSLVPAETGLVLKILVCYKIIILLFWLVSFYKYMSYSKSFSAHSKDLLELIFKHVSI